MNISFTTLAFLASIKYLARRVKNVLISHYYIEIRNALQFFRGGTLHCIFVYLEKYFSCVDKKAIRIYASTKFTM